MQINPEFKAFIPKLSDTEYAQLEENILSDGIREPISLWRDTIIDGHNRYEIAQRHRLKYSTVSYDFDNENDAILWIIKNQFGRRNLPAYVRGELQEKARAIIAKRAKENQRLSQGQGVKVVQCCITLKTNAELSKISNISERQQAKVKTIVEKAIEPVKELARREEISINQAERAAKLDKETQEKIVPLIKEKDLTVEKAVIEIKKQEREAVIQEQIERTVAMPTGKYSCIVIDPPWSYGTKYSPDGRRVANPYPEMSQDELKELEILSEPDSIIFLWTTHKYIWDAKELLDCWGYEYRSMIVWDKDKMGMGDFLRMQCEFCLVGIKGNPILNNPHNIRDIIREPRREHSRKPEAFYEMVETLCRGSKIEYFSRTPRNGWESYGNDTEKFDMAI